jgi:hypothetical protein
VENARFLIFIIIGQLGSFFAKSVEERQDNVAKTLTCGGRRG